MPQWPDGNVGIAAGPFTMLRRAAKTSDRRQHLATDPPDARPTGPSASAPELIGTQSRDPRITLTVMARCLRVALAVAPQDRDMQQALQRIEIELSRLADPRARRRARWRSLVGELGALSVISTLRVMLKRTHRFRGPRHDEQLRELLEGAIADCRGLLAKHSGPVGAQQSLPPVTGGRTS
jgi:hypothetical protein